MSVASAPGADAGPTVDPPAPGAPEIAFATDETPPVTGTLNGGDTTNDPDLRVRVRLTGTGAKAGDTVRLYDGVGATVPLGAPHTLNGMDIHLDYTTLSTGALRDGATYALTARITDAAGTLGAASAVFEVVVDTVAPVLDGLSIGHDDAAAGIGDTITYTLTMDAPVTVTGTPELALGGGRVATYDATASDLDGDGRTASLVFTHRVDEGDTPALLAATALELDRGDAVADLAGNPLTATALPAADRAAVVDTTRPRPSALTVAQSRFPIARIGDTLAYTLTVDGPVTVAGTPELALGGARAAAYEAALSDPAAGKLVFTYEVRENDAGGDLAAVALTPDQGEAIRDGAGNAPLATALTALAEAARVDAIRPALSVLSAELAPGQGGAANIGDTVVLTLVAGEAVTVGDGSPTLILSGGTAAYAGAGPDGRTLGFTYTVKEGDTTAALTVAGLDPNGATIRDAAGNLATTAGVNGFPPGASALGLDAVRPELGDLAVAYDGATAAIGDRVRYVLTADAPVVVTGAPGLTLGGGRVAGYSPTLSAPDGDGRTVSLVFTYTVRENDTAADLIAGSWNPNGATIRDGAGNDLLPSGVDLSGPTGAVSLDGLRPTLGKLAVGQSQRPVAGIDDAIIYTLTADAPVTVVGAPGLTLGGGRAARYSVALSDPDSDGRTVSLVFTYTVRPGDADGDLVVTGLDLGTGGAVADPAGNALLASGVDVSHATGKASVDAVRPTLGDLVASPGGGTLRAGQTVTLRLTASERVTVDTAGGTPELVLNSGGRATYAGADSTGRVLAFAYTPAAGESAAALAVMGLDLGGATIQDAAGNPADLSGAAADPAGIIAVDAIAPDAPGAPGFEARPASDRLFVRGTAEAGSTIQVYRDTEAFGTATAGPADTWAMPLAGEMDAGTYVFTATATDTAGNVSPASSASTLTVERRAPAGARPSPTGLETGARGVAVARTAAGDLLATRGAEAWMVQGVEELRFLDGRLVFDPDDAATRVARLYHAGLGRDVDQGRLDHWAETVEAGVPLGALAEGFLASPESRALYGADASDAEFVALLYRNALGREGDEGGVVFWMRRLGEGAARADVLAAVADSGENRHATASQGVWDLDEGAAQVARLYDAVFGRSPDRNGLAHWAEAVRAGRATLQGVAEGFMASPEYQAPQASLSNGGFVQALYRDTLDRPGDEGGVGHWTMRLDAGLSRAALVVSFSESAEHIALTAPDILGGVSGDFGIRLA